MRRNADDRGPLAGLELPSPSPELLERTLQEAARMPLERGAATRHRMSFFDTFFTRFSDVARMLLGDRLVVAAALLAVLTCSFSWLDQTGFAVSDGRKPDPTVASTDLEQLARELDLDERLVRPLLERSVAAELGRYSSDRHSRSRRGPDTLAITELLEAGLLEAEL